MVSVVMDYGRNIPQQNWDMGNWNEYQEILRRIESLDKKLGEPECHDPAKAEWMKQVEDRQAALEKAQPKRRSRKKS